MHDTTVKEMDRCRRLVGQIQNLNHTETEELFKILHRNKCKYTVNNNGVFINMAWLSDDTLTQIEQFIQFCSHSLGVLERYENICQELNQDMQAARIHPPPSTHSMELPIIDATLQEKTQTDEPAAEEEEKKSTVSSSMRFYLLKKRFAKGCGREVGLVNDLKHENVIIKK